MPTKIDRFRLLSNGGIRNESQKKLHVRAYSLDHPTEVPPGEESPLPVTPEGETIIDVVQDR